MDLHRIGKKPEWADVAVSDRNRWQHLAAATHAVVTPGNFLTAVGFGLTTYGIIALAGRQYWLGLIAMAIGRLFDIADGWMAAKTGTKSPLGELLDAGSDKVITFGALIVLGASGLVAWWVIICLTVPQAIILIISLQHLAIGSRLHPTRAGKLSMASAWAALVVLILATATSGTFSNFAYILGYFVVVIAVGLNIFATYGYIFKPQTD
jgi:phosphatidylglycerophosphate synthase